MTFSHLQALGLLGLFVGCGAVPIALGEEPVTLSLNLVSGDVIEGQPVSENDTELVLRRHTLCRHKIVVSEEVIEKDQIIKRNRIPSFTVQYQARLKTTADSLEGHLAMARWCLDHCLLPEAGEQVRKANDIDDDNPMVAKLFGECGYIHDQDAWVQEDAYLAKTGKVDLNGTIMTVAEADKAKAVGRATLAHDNAATAIKEDLWLMSHGAEQIKALTDKVAKAKETLTKAKADMATAKSNIDTITKRQAAAEQQAANQQNNNNNGNGNGFFGNGGGGNGNGNGNGFNRNNTNNAENDLAAANAALSTAQQAEHRAERSEKDLSQQLDRLKTRTAKAKDDLPIQQGLLAKADSDLTTLTGKAPPPTPGGTPGSTSDGKTATDADKDKDKDEDTADDATPKPKSRFGK